MKKMKRIYEKPIEKYQYNDDYFVDIAIVTNDLEVVFEAWLYKKGYGVKMLMYGMPARQINYEYYKECVEADVDDYIEMYKESYEKEELEV